ncbi:ABC transporter ATP-binding protein [Salinispira pacifica]
MSVKLVDISKVFSSSDRHERRVVAVKGVNLEVSAGEMVTLLGPSGCGKTTTLRIVSGFEPPTTGEVWIDNEMVNALPPNKRDTSMVFQSYAIFPHLTVSQNIGFGLELKGWKPARIRAEVEKIMSVMDLRDMFNRRPDQLSGGQQQRVALARAIINKPSVLLFDEPLSNLDAKLRELMRLEIRRIQQTFRITSIYVTHDQAEAMTVSDRIVVMNDGEIMQVGAPFEIYSRPANRFVADFIGRVNFIEGTAVGARDGETIVDFGAGSKTFSNLPDDRTRDGNLIAVVRPESLQISRSGSATGGLLEGRIAKSVYLGPTVEYEVEIEGRSRPLLAVVYNPIEAGFFSAGERVVVDFNPAAAHLLPG